MRRRRLHSGPEFSSENMYRLCQQNKDKTQHVWAKNGNGIKVEYRNAQRATGLVCVQK